ncbi:MAG: PadR family transcriptional regulator [Actinomycetota bacterium]
MALSATSYALLGLLASEPGSAYDLVKRVRLELAHFWPRSERRLFDEPKRLAAQGLVEPEERWSGKRKRTVYRVTAAGRAALAEWMERPSAPPAFESEAILKVSLGQLATKGQILDTLTQTQRWAEGVLEEGRAIAGSIVDGPADPQRSQFSALMFDFVFRHAELVADWAERSAAEVATWDDAGPAPLADLAVFHSALERTAR